MLKSEIEAAAIARAELVEHLTPTHKAYLLALLQAFVDAPCMYFADTYDDDAAILTCWYCRQRHDFRRKVEAHADGCLRQAAHDFLKEIGDAR